MLSTFLTLLLKHHSIVVQSLKKKKKKKLSYKLNLGEIDKDHNWSC